jgi:FkbM family methyltransferase
VIAFEPDPQNFGWLRRSVDLNGYRCVECLQLALSDEDGEADLFVGDRIGRHTLVQTHPHEQETIKVEVRTLDSVLMEMGRPRVDVIKIDVEGAELRLLHGASETLAANRGLKLFIDIHPGRQDPRPVCKLLTDQGFSLRVPSDPDSELGEVPADLREVFAFRD